MKIIKLTAMLAAVTSCVTFTAYASHLIQPPNVRDAMHPNITQPNTRVIGRSPSIAMGTLYQEKSGALALSQGELFQSEPNALVAPTIKPNPPLPTPSHLI